MKRTVSQCLWLALLLTFLFYGCESGQNKSVTGDFFDRKAGDLLTVTATFDSLIPYSENPGEESYVFAGKYKNVSAFSVYKFPLPDADLIDREKFQSASLSFNVPDYWLNGPVEFGLFEATSDWSDSVRLDPDDFPFDPDSPISTFSDTASSIGSLNFVLTEKTIEYIRSWSRSGSFIVAGTTNCESMMALSAFYSNYIPKIEYVFTIADGVLDSTSTSCIESNYYFNTGFNPDEIASGMTGIISDADNRAFVLKLTIPEQLPSTAVINQCIAHLTIDKNLSLIPTNETFDLGVYQLDNTLTVISEANYDSGTIIESSVTEEATVLEFDITDHIQAWHIDKNSNFGILIKSSLVNNAPKQLVLTPESTLTIWYTSVPKDTLIVKHSTPPEVQ
ncbi:MAG: hypothetical protein JXB48_10660 [Candidatus Latescibacteria bacterium]|nr:hypothetical protein [Candidatus Latescibacterota bacterium]